jgi:hypothetical protein
VIAANPGKDITNQRAFLRHVKHLAERMILDQQFRQQFAPFNSLLTKVFAEDTVVGSQGITIGGEGAEDVRILNNTIDGVMEGIQVGQSNANDQNKLSSRTVTISGNTLSIVLTSASIKTDRHAIFAGNCESLLIENNRALLTRASTADKFEIDGIRVWGQLGDRALVTKNHLASADGNRQRSFTIGIRMQPLQSIQLFDQLWLVDFNVAPSRQQTVFVTNGAQEERNVPAPGPQP